MGDGVRTALLYSALVVGAFAVAFAAGYVYAHGPERDALVVQFEGSPAAAGPRTVSGIVVSVDAASLTLRTEQGDITIALPAETPVEELTRVDTLFTAQTPVNVGVERTQYGLVLTGIVHVDGGTRSSP